MVATDISSVNFPAFREQLQTISSFLLMTLVYKNLLPQNILFPNSSNISCRRKPTLERGAGKRLQIVNSQNKKKCLRCNTLFEDKDNSPIACSFHGHTNGDKGLFSLAPPHQGIDGEWSDGSGVIVYKWNDKDKRPNTGRKNWKKRWSCCAEYDENAPPCRQGWHVSYDDGFTLY